MLPPRKSTPSADRCAVDKITNIQVLKQIEYDLSRVLEGGTEVANIGKVV